ncbi:hypothetical protein IF1G_11215 [Cordyceps javanica]|uniref:Uncharacterized protein n=1 Tax=Cordyceps javanica TaxID=43265 RepID=A0A545UKW5_9HYPO|nr:hypothetical protein IF1G_11215 [Cordyceps javanica]TQW01599.1 hypothetical protein IF2G_10863 [Cordyceps javanica]
MSARNDPRLSHPPISPPAHGRLLSRSFAAQRPDEYAGSASTGGNHVLSLQIGSRYEIWYSYRYTSFAARLAQSHPDLDSVDFNPAPAIRPKTVAVLLWILHAVLFLLSIPIGGRAEDIVFNIIRNINAVFINPLFTLIATIAVFTQVRAMPNQLMGCSHWTLGAQSFTYLILAISWPFRLILPPNMWGPGSKPDQLLQWYRWVGWACVNNAILAIGQGVMLFLSISRVADGHLNLADERRPLIGSDEIQLTINNGPNGALKGPTPFSSAPEIRSVGGARPQSGPFQPLFELSLASRLAPPPKMAVGWEHLLHDSSTEMALHGKQRSI